MHRNNQVTVLPLCVLNPIFLDEHASYSFMTGGKAASAEGGVGVDSAATAPRRVSAAGASKLNMVGASLRPRPEMMGNTLGYSR